MNLKPNMRLGSRDFPPPRVIITLMALQKIRAFAAACPVEINGRGYIERVGNNFLITDVFILHQWATRDEVETYDEALHGLIFQLAKEGRSTESLKFQWHSHANHAVFFSPKDLDTIAKYKADYHISLVVNKLGESLCRVDLYRPFRAEFEVELEILLPPPDEAMVAECQKDVKELVDLPLFGQRIPRAIAKIRGVAEQPVAVPPSLVKGDSLIHQDAPEEE